MFEMHPSEMKNLALAAAAAAERDGFPGTAESWAEIARSCGAEAVHLEGQGADVILFSTASYSLETVAALLLLV